MSDLKVLQGGLKDYQSTEYEYIDGYVTDTRLMGVLGLRLHWQTCEGFKDQSKKNVYTFFYFDIEELGLDTFNMLEIDNDDAVELATKSSFGGLGAVMHRISERQARYLVNFFIEDTKRKGIELPKGINKASFIIKYPIVLTDEEEKSLIEAMCTEVDNDYGVVNYYLMRLFGKDYKGASYLRNSDLPDTCFDDVSPSKISTFLANTIDDFVDNRGCLSYLCQSLIETENGHQIVLSELTVANGKVQSCKKKSAMQISITEASMLLRKSEYVTVYGVETHQQIFDLDFAVYSIGCTRTEHENGIMFMEFKPNNLHVNEKKYHLSDDVEAIYFVTNFGQMVVASYSLEGIQRTENRIHSCLLGRDLTPLAKFQFDESVVYEFALSGETDFIEFIKNLE